MFTSQNRPSLFIISEKYLFVQLVARSLRKIFMRGAEVDAGKLVKMLTIFAGNNQAIPPTIISIVARTPLPSGVGHRQYFPFLLGTFFA